MFKMSRQFDYVEVQGVNDSLYDMQHEHSFTTNMGELDVAMVAETLPGDNWKIKSELFMRVAPFIAPVMHRIDTFQYAFYIPNRLIWRNWNDFQKNSADTTTFNDNKEYVPPVHPYFTLQQLATLALTNKETMADKVSFTATGASLRYLFFLNKRIISLLENCRLPINPLSETFIDDLITTEYSGGTWTDQGRADVKKVLMAHRDQLPLAITRNNFAIEVNIPQKYGYSEKRLSSLPLRAYFKIWFDWFRDKNFESVAFDFDSDGQESNSQLRQLVTLRKKCWEHDYLTSCLPDPQRGPDVALAIAGDTSADVSLKADTTNNGLWKYASDHNLTANAQLMASVSGVPSPVGGKGTSSNLVLEATSVPATAQGASTSYQVNTSSYDSPAVYDPNGTLEVPLSIEFGFTINELRYQSKLQQFYETFARVGNRIKEWLKAFFNVDLSDARAMVSEYYGGTRVPVQISSVEQTSQSDESTNQPLGQLAGRGQTSNVKTFDIYSPESGFVFILQSTLPTTKYMNALPTMWTRQTYLDYCIPLFQSLGEQEVKKHEVFFDMRNDTTNDAVFGYQARYQDYKTMTDLVCGDFKRSLNFYTMARDFDSAPSLNADFVTAQPTTRVYAVEDQDYDHLWCALDFDIALSRKLAYYSIPKLD